MTSLIETLAQKGYPNCSMTGPIPVMVGNKVVAFSYTLHMPLVEGNTPPTFVARGYVVQGTPAPRVVGKITHELRDIGGGKVWRAELARYINVWELIVRSKGT